MQIDPGNIVECISDCLVNSVAELTALDAAIGDADHGLNMKRGAEALLARRHEIASSPLPVALHVAGLALAMSIGGAAGPLYGSLFMAMGKAIGLEPDLRHLGPALAAGAAAIERLGQVRRGDKTMLDVWQPVALHVASGGATIQSIRQTAQEAAAATIPMVALRGRASHLGDRSRGHMDPGARSSELIIHAVSDALERTHERTDG